MTQNKQLKHKRVKTAKKPKKQPEELTFLDHAYELRTRLFWVAATLTVASAIGFFIKDQLIAVIMAPLHGQKLVYLTPGGGFGFIFTLSIYFGALLTIPVIVYHLFRFLEPLLSERSRRQTGVFITVSILLAAAGAVFSYFVTIATAIHFFSSFASNSVTANLTTDSYLNFVLMHILGLAAVFQIPLVLVIFDNIRPIPPKKLLSTQKYAVIGALLIAGLFVPTPDITLMAIATVPMIVIYEFGVLAILFRHWLGGRRHKQVNAADGDEPLMTIIEELRELEDETATARPVIPLSDVMAPALAVAVPAPVASVSMSQAVAAVPKPNPVQPKRIDGIVALRRSAPITPVVPARSTPTPAPRPAPRSVVQGARRIDGFAPRRFA
ncbi:MAG TPA: twin-arginine translocase subunit TatC [Candidatus Bathyarchaeia archaeon]|nr:twin-arginine translocase subunit TatC [Candidatus Bathyarchaeia archaeon]